MRAAIDVRMHDIAVWTIAAAAIAAMLVRPLRTGEWLWPVLGAALLVACGLVSGAQAARAALDGAQVYAFLLGMLALAETSRVYGIFEWIGGNLVQGARGRASALFARLFIIAAIVTAFLSNDGTIVLLTPAAVALARASGVRAQPFAYVVAFVANAASFVLPFSNPANLVVFANLPPLAEWLARFAAPSASALVCTYIVLRVRYAGELRGQPAPRAAIPALAREGRIVLVAVVASLALLVAAAAAGWPVGYTALGLGAACMLVAASCDRAAAWRACREGSWQIVPLVAGLFVIVRALDTTGAIGAARALFAHASQMPPLAGRLYAGGAVMLADALINNLPAGVIVRYALHGTAVAQSVAHAALVGVDLGPNLSISGSLATLLWLMMLRRENVRINAWRFLGLGALVTLPALAAALITLG